MPARESSGLSFECCGHHASAGAMLNGTLGEIVDQVIPAARAYVAALPDEAE